MNHWRGELTNVWRSFERRMGGKELTKVRWIMKLVFASVICACISIVGLHFTESVQNARQAESLERQHQDRLAEAARAWAVQRTLVEIAKDNSSGRASARTAVRPLLDKFEAQAREALGWKKPPDPKPTPALYKYLLEEDTQLRGVLMTIAKRGAVALLIISILFFLAIILIPFVKNLRTVGEQRAEEALKPPEDREPVGGGSSPAPFPVPVPTVPPPVGLIGGAPGGMSGFVAGFRQNFVPMVIAAGAVVTIGAMLINVNGGDMSVVPTVHAPNVDLKVDDFAVAVQPGRIDIPSVNVIPSAPKIEANIPPVVFQFPALRVEQQALTALTAELEEYRKTLQQISAHDQRLAAQQEKIEHLDRDNSALLAELKFRPTQEQLAKVEADLEAHKDLESKIETDLKSLASSSSEIRYGDRVAAQQYTRQLNVQNQHIFNQLFRPGYIRGNCLVYDSLKSKLPDLPDCTDAWLNKKLFPWRSSPKPSQPVVQTAGTGAQAPQPEGKN